MYCLISGSITPLLGFVVIKIEYLSCGLVSHQTKADIICWTDFVKDRGRHRAIDCMRYNRGGKKLIFIIAILPY